MSTESSKPPETREQRVRAACELRKNGLSYAAIGKANHTSATTARKDVARALDALTKDQVRDGVGLDLERLDTAIAIVNRDMRKDDTAAVDRLIRLLSLRGRMLEQMQSAAAEQALPVKVVSSINWDEI